MSLEDPRVLVVAAAILSYTLLSRSLGRRCVGMPAANMGRMRFKVSLVVGFSPGSPPEQDRHNAGGERYSNPVEVVVHVNFALLVLIINAALRCRAARTCVHTMLSPLPYIKGRVLAVSPGGLPAPRLPATRPPVSRRPESVSTRA